MNRYLRLLALNVEKQVLTWSGSWWFAVALAAGQILPPLIALALWHSISPKSSQVSSYYLAIVFVVATTASYEHHLFAYRVYQGALAEELVRPVPVFLSPLAENLAIRVWISVAVFPVIVGIAVSTNIKYRPGAIFLAVPLWLGAGLLRFLFTWCLAMSAFWTGRVHGVTNFGTTLMYLLGGTAIPVELFPAPWDGFARVLPFYPMAGLPADVAAGKVTGFPAFGFLALGVWLAVMGALAVWSWQRGLNRYTTVGA